MTQRPRNYETHRGRPRDLERHARQEQFRLTRRQRLLLTDAVMVQLCQCRSDEARKLLLGVR